MVDNSDQQYASFRDNVPYLIIVMALHPVLRRVFDTVYSSSNSASHHTSKDAVANSSLSPRSDSPQADSRLNQRILFDVGFSLLFLVALHGFSAAKVLLILYVNFNIATRLKRNYVPLVTWVFNIGILFANELGRGYPLSSIVDRILPASTSPQSALKQDPKLNWGTVLDSYGGLIPRWEVLFNVTVLRLISFNLDYYWSLNGAGGNPIEVRESRNIED